MKVTKRLWQMVASIFVVAAISGSTRGADIFASSIIGSAEGYHSVSNHLACHSNLSRSLLRSPGNFEYLNHRTSFL